MKLRKLIIIGCMAALCATACGSDKSSSSSTSSSQDVPASTQTSTEASSQAADPASSSTVADSSSAAADSSSTAEPAANEVDLDACAKALLDEGIFTAELTALSESAIPNFFTVEAGNKAVVYMANNGSADSFGLFKAADETAANNILTNVKDYITGVKDNAALYTPEDVPKIEAAVVNVYGNYAVFCISNDAAKAKEIIERFFQ